MISGELKSVIAQNCEEYDSYSTLYKMSMGAHYRSCSNCCNYVQERCNKNLQDEMKTKLSRN
jgi:ribosomal protein L19E